jgi:hypothetical protein
MSDMKRDNTGSPYMQSVFLTTRVISNAPENNIPEPA